MKTALSILALALGVAVAAWAGDFESSPGSGKCSKVSPGNCCQALIESDLADIVVDVRGLAVSVTFDMDDDGLTSGTTVTLHACKHPDDVQANCNPYEWDTTGNGVVDSNILDGVTRMQRGVSNVQVPWLLVDPTNHVQDARISVCALSTG